MRLGFVVGERSGVMKLRSIKWKYNFEDMDVNYIDLVASSLGDTSRLVHAFTWGATPQSNFYWANQYYGSTSLDKGTIADMIEQYEVWCCANCSNLEFVQVP